MNKFRWFRKLNPTIWTKKYRCFSVAIRSAKHSTPLSFRLLKSTEADSNLEDSRFQSKIKEIEINKFNSERKLFLAKDRAFLKVLTSINLESKDNEWILLSRLIAYNIINNIKAESNFSKETFTGIAKALYQILEFFEKVSESATEEELRRKSSNVHQKGKFDVAKLLNFLISDSDDKVLLFTKEVTTRPAEGRVNTHTGFSVDAGHSSHTFINDHVNYRVDMHHPIVYIWEELTLEDANKVIELSLMKRSDVIFIANKVDADIQKFLISKKFRNSNWNIFN